MKNIEFSYLYRDAGNYKKWGKVIFSNPDRLGPTEVNKALQGAFLDGDLFVAQQVRIPEVFLFADGDATSDDHCFHEFDTTTLTTQAADDTYSRSIKEFIAEVEQQANRGWAEFDPRERSRNTSWNTHL